MKKYDIIIVGAGPAGFSFALSLAKTDLRILIIDKSSIDELRDVKYDGREIALTHPSIDILKKMGVWQDICDEGISPIKEAKVFDGDSDYSLDFNNKKEPQTPLGYLAANNLIRQSLFKQINQYDNIKIIAGVSVENINNTKNSESSFVTLSNKSRFQAVLIVAADSRFSKLRPMAGISAKIHDFARTMLVCKMRHEKCHNNIALECFDYDRVLAILPLSKNTSSIVMTLPTNLAKDVINMSKDRFNNDITQRFRNELGEMSLISDHYSYPLVATYADKFISHNFALIGDAAVGMHPVTAHGFNLGLLGQDTLAKAIRLAISQGEDINSVNLLEGYQKQHIKNTKLLYHATNNIVSLFTNNNFPARYLRKMTLRIANNKLLPFKHMITNRLTDTKNPLREMIYTVTKIKSRNL